MPLLNGGTSILKIAAPGQALPRSRHAHRTPLWLVRCAHRISNPITGAFFSITRAIPVFPETRDFFKLPFEVECCHCEEDGRSGRAADEAIYRIFQSQITESHPLAVENYVYSRNLMWRLPSCLIMPICLLAGTFSCQVYSCAERRTGIRPCMRIGYFIVGAE